MEKQTQTNGILTKAENGAVLTAAEAEEFRAYKRKKRIAEVTGALARSEAGIGNGEDVQRVCERAVRLRQAAVRLPLTKLSMAAYYLKTSGVKLDCTVGGDGETLAKVKAYEAKLAVKRGAGEITVAVTPSFLDSCRYNEIRRELKKVRRAVGRATLKVRMEKTSSPTTVARVARLASDAGAAFFSVPYFPGCERIRVDMTNGCKLEVSGVNTAELLKSLIAAGVGRVVTERAWEIYSEWIREANEEPIASEVKPKTEEKPASAPTTVGKLLVTSKPDPETDYRCRLEGSDLKFL
ncbi:MAG: hypothetical protein IJX91_01905 [Clostridia bacterium]|nr:hypothetical protein [Clostridia bacterium]